MRKLHFNILLLSFCLGFGPMAVAGQVAILNLVGTGQGSPGTVPDIDGDGVADPAMCFEVDLADLRTGQIIGSGVDCLSDVQMGDNGGMVLVGTGFFHMPNGTLITRGTTTVQPVNAETISPKIGPVTHITGAGGGLENAVIGGTGRYRGATGTARLSGMVNLENEPNGEISFDCIFVVDLD